MQMMVERSNVQVTEMAATMVTAANVAVEEPHRRQADAIVQIAMATQLLLAFQAVPMLLFFGLSSEPEAVGAAIRAITYHIDNILRTDSRDTMVNALAKARESLCTTLQEIMDAAVPTLEQLVGLERAGANPTLIYYAATKFGTTCATAVAIRERAEAARAVEFERLRDDATLRVHHAGPVAASCARAEGRM
jgi:hypothetical protein